MTPGTPGKAQALDSIKRLVREELELDIGVLEELGPSAYNRGVADAQRFFQDRALDLDGTCHEEELGYRAAPTSKSRRGR